MATGHGATRWSGVVHGSSRGVWLNAGGAVSASGGVGRRQWIREGAARAGRSLEDRRSRRPEWRGRDGMANIRLECLSGGWARSEEARMRSGGATEEEQGMGATT